MVLLKNPWRDSKVHVLVTIGVASQCKTLRNELLLTFFGNWIGDASSALWHMIASREYSCHAKAPINCFWKLTISKY